jgi:hypothetical protein
MGSCSHIKMKINVSIAVEEAVLRIFIKPLILNVYNQWAENIVVILIFEVIPCF